MTVGILRNGRATAKGSSLMEVCDIGMIEGMLIEMLKAVIVLWEMDKILLTIPPAHSPRVSFIVSKC